MAKWVCYQCGDEMPCEFNSGPDCDYRPFTCPLDSEADAEWEEIAND